MTKLVIQYYSFESQSVENKHDVIFNFKKTPVMLLGNNSYVQKK